MKNQFTEKKLLRQKRACKLLSVNSSQSIPWSEAERSEAKRNGMDWDASKLVMAGQNGSSVEFDQEQ
jgi:hypothetical protein